MVRNVRLQGQMGNGTSKPIKRLHYSLRVVIPEFRGISALSRETLKRKQGRNTIDFTADSEHIELTASTIRSASQLSINGGVSTWCIERSGRIQGQASLGVNVSISEEHDKLSKQLNPQEVGSLARSLPRAQGPAGNCWPGHLQRSPHDDFR